MLTADRTQRGRRRPALPRGCYRFLNSSTYWPEGGRRRAAAALVTKLPAATNSNPAA
jgi:hypothetical protein